ncbi:MAG: hypothetical protein KAI47_02255, partial [Deltaproteobacteria bacterium]|nr:hypothetical protein [Deltaproteobacteria bacterium]
MSLIHDERVDADILPIDEVFFVLEFLGQLLLRPPCLELRDLLIGRRLRAPASDFVDAPRSRVPEVALLVLVDR